MTWPNVLVLDYLIRTDQLTPDIELEARSYINAGYQRLLTFECDGGGFDWFGDPNPPNQDLTAIGLLELTDMAAVHPVDPELLARTRRWLLVRQSPDGSWAPPAEGAFSVGFANGQARTTAFVTWALAWSGETDPGVARAADWLAANAAAQTDPYTRALFAHALLAADRHGDTVRALLDELAEDAEVGGEGDEVRWSAEDATVCGSWGWTSEVEATALVAEAFLRAEQHADLAAKALTWIVRQKSPQGTWGSTQATVLALRALLLSAEAPGGDAGGGGTVVVTMNGAEVQTLDIAPETSDVMRTVPLQPWTTTGRNTLDLTFAGDGRFLYQAVATWHVPWALLPPPPEGELAIAVAYDATDLAVDDVVNVAVTVTNRRAEDLFMVIVDIGQPPGFDLVPDALDEAVTTGLLAKYEATGRQVILYVRAIPALATVELRYGLRARWPLEVTTPPTQAYLYYQPEVRATAPPVTLTVE